MSLGLQGLKAVLGEGARSNKYKIVISELGGENVAISAKGSTLPEVTLGQAEVWSQGRKVPLGGDVEYSTWDVTFYNDPTLQLRKKVEKWIKDIDDYKANTSNKLNIGDYGKELKATQLNRAGSPSGGTYTFHDAFPVTVSTTELGSDSANQVSEFTVTFAYTYWSHD